MGLRRGAARAGYGACCALALAAMPARAEPPAPAPSAGPAWPNDAETCRVATEAVLHGRIDAAADAVMPDGASDRARRQIRALMRQLASRAGAMTGGQPPRLERDLPALRLDGVPVSIGIWSFGDRAVFLVGCGIRPAGEVARIGIEAYPTRELVLSHLRAALDGAPDDPP